MSTVTERKKKWIKLPAGPEYQVQVNKDALKHNRDNRCSEAPTITVWVEDSHEEHQFHEVRFRDASGGLKFNGTSTRLILNCKLYGWVDPDGFPFFPMPC